MAQTSTMASASRTTLRPLHDRVLVQRLAERDAHGRIHIPDTAKEKPQEGRVIAVGAGRVGDDGTRIPVAVKKGDRVLFAKYSGAEVTLDGSEYLVMKEEDVLGILG
jgi:chaperonin GroES